MKQNTENCEVVTSSPNDLATAHLRHSHDLPERHRQAMAQDAIGEINAFHRRAVGAAEVARHKAAEATHFALLAGTRLEQLKSATPHGEWGKLFDDRRNLTPNAAQIGECAAFGVRLPGNTTLIPASSARTLPRPAKTLRRASRIPSISKHPWASGFFAFATEREPCQP